MNVIDRSVISDIHAAARRHRAVYLGCLFTSLRNRLAGLLHNRAATRTAPCA